MRVPLSWLKEYVEIALPLPELAERMTFAGLEVAAIEQIGAEWDRDKIVVGEIVEVRPHPNADRLTIAVVDHGADEPQAVVTGAANLKIGDRGQKVAFARQGAKLIDGYSEELRYITLKPAKIRGVCSAGMVCSEKELGLSDEHEGILILDNDAPVGMPLQDYLGDAVLDIDLTPNLGRCLSIVGVAREVAALTGQPLKLTEPTMKAADRDRDCRSGPVLTLQRHVDQRGKGRSFATMDATASACSRDAPRQLHRGHHELRDAGMGAAAACL